MNYIRHLETHQQETAAESNIRQLELEEKRRKDHGNQLLTRHPNFNKAKKRNRKERSNKRAAQSLTQLQRS